MKLPSMPGFALVAGLSLVGCATTGTTSASTASNPAVAGAGDDEAAASLAEHHRHHSHSGVTHFIAMSLDTLGADDAKKPQIEKIQADLHEKMKPAREAEKAVTEVLAEGVASGNIDKFKVDAAITALASTASAVHEASLDSLNELHNVLSPAERAALSDKVRAHWEVWRRENHEAAPGSREHGSRLTNLAEELTLTPDQVEKISEALKTAMAPMAGKFDPAEIEGHVNAFATAFTADTFDAKTLTIGGSANAHMATHGATRMATFYETVTPLLTPEQRTKLAERLREHLTHAHAHQAT